MKSGGRINFIYLFLKYERLHQLIRMLGHAFSNFVDIMYHVLVGNVVVLPFL